MQHYIAGFISGVALLVGLGAVGSLAQQPAAPQQKPPFQIAIEQQIGGAMVELAIARSNVEQLQAALAQRDKEIAELKAQLGKTETVPVPTPKPK